MTYSPGAHRYPAWHHGGTNYPRRPANVPAQPRPQEMNKKPKRDAQTILTQMNKDFGKKWRISPTKPVPPERAAEANAALALLGSGRKINTR